MRKSTLIKTLKSINKWIEWWKMTEPTKEQVMSALENYRTNYTDAFNELPDSLKDEVHGVNYSEGMESNEIIALMCGYLAAKKSDFEEIENLKLELEMANVHIKSRDNLIEKDAMDYKKKDEFVVESFSKLKDKDQEIKALKEQLAAEVKQREKAENALRDIVTVAVFGRDNFLKIEKLISEYFSEKTKPEQRKEG